MGAGSTATVMVHDRSLRRITVAHVGDSGACLGRDVPPLSCLQRLCGAAPKPCLALTQDHKPQHNEERKRIESAGGSIVFDGYFNYRVFAEGKDYPGLNMSRAMGDVKGQLEAGISAEPTVFELDLGERDTTLILCSDGVWEFMTAKEVADYVSSETRCHSATPYRNSAVSRKSVGFRRREMSWMTSLRFWYASRSGLHALASEFTLA